MMSPLLRVEMLLAAFVVTTIVLYYVNRKQVRVAYMLIWLLIAAALLLLACFPGIASFLCRLTSIQTPSNLIYLFGIFLLLWITFRLTVRTSRQADEIKRLTQIVSMEKHRSAQEDTHEIHK